MNVEVSRGAAGFELETSVWWVVNLISWLSAIQARANAASDMISSGPCYKFNPLAERTVKAESDRLVKMLYATCSEWTRRSRGQTQANMLICRINASEAQLERKRIKSYWAMFRIFITHFILYLLQILYVDIFYTLFIRKEITMRTVLDFSKSNGQISIEDRIFCMYKEIRSYISFYHEINFKNLTV